MRPKRPLYYILHGHEARPTDLHAWAQYFETTDRTVAQTDTPHGTRISTVFLGIDHNYTDTGPPLLFETRIFGGEHDGNGKRYATWKEAEAGHAAIVAEVTGLNN